MKSQLKLSDTPEADEFFRRGDEHLHVADSLQPTVSFDDSDALTDPRLLRTPAQRKRRASLIKLVSLIMAFLTIGAAGAFVGTLKKHAAPEGEARLDVAPTSVPTNDAETVSARADSLTPVAGSAVSDRSGEVAEPSALMTPGAASAAEGTPNQGGPRTASAVTAEVVAASSSHEETPRTESKIAESPVGAEDPAVQPAAAVDGSGASSVSLADTKVPQSLAPLGAAAANASASAVVATETKAAAGTARKPVSRVRVAPVRRHSAQAPHARAAKSAVRASESNPAPSPTPSAKPDDYRPPTASFADD